MIQTPGCSFRRPLKFAPPFPTTAPGLRGLGTGLPSSATTWNECPRQRQAANLRGAAIQNMKEYALARLDPNWFTVTNIRPLM